MDIVILEMPRNVHLLPKGNTENFEGEIRFLIFALESWNWQQYT